MSFVASSRVPPMRQHCRRLRRCITQASILQKMFATTYAAMNGVSGVTVSTTVKAICLNALMPPTYNGCSATGAVNNAIRVTETATIQTYLMRVLGMKTLTVSALATASMQGKAQAWNVVIIVDATGSMGTDELRTARADAVSVRHEWHSDLAARSKSLHWKRHIDLQFSCELV